MRKLVSILLTLAVAVSLCLVTAVPVGAQDPAVFQSGGDRLVATQNTDGGWPWPLDEGVSATNINGPVGIGLAQAYRQTNDSVMCTALEATGGFLLAKTNTFTCWDGYLAVQLDDIFGVTTYTDYVKDEFYDKLKAGTYERSDTNTYSTDTYIAAVGAAGGAWNLGIGLVSAVSIGIDQSEIDKWVAGVKVALCVTPKADPYYPSDLAGGLYGLAYAGETEFTGTVGGSTMNSVADLADELASLQMPSGVFRDGMELAQDTAYALLALNEVDRISYMDNITRAGAYLENAQLGTGGWLNGEDDTDPNGRVENNEMTGEALWALSVVSSSSVGLTVNVLDITAISVTPTNINFGTLKPGEESAVEIITVMNVGTHTVDVDASATGSALFEDNLKLRNEFKDWTNWVTGTPWDKIVADLVMDESNEVRSKLTVPLDYTPIGTEAATLIFEATGV